MYTTSMYRNVKSRKVRRLTLQAELNGGGLMKLQTMALTQIKMSIMSVTMITLIIAMKLQKKLARDLLELWLEHLIINKKSLWH